MSNAMNDLLAQYRSRFVPRGAAWYRADGEMFRRDYGLMPEETLSEWLLRARADDLETAAVGAGEGVGTPA